MRRAFWILLTPLACFLALWLLGSIFLGPRIESWALDKIQKYSESDLPVNIQAQHLRLSLFKPSLSLENIRIQAKGDLQDSVPDIHVRSIRVFIDFFQLLGGRLNLSAVVIDSANVEINLDSFLKDAGPAKALPIDEVFVQIEKVPLQRLFLHNIQAKVYSQNLEFRMELNSGDILITNMGKNLTLKAAVPALQLNLDKIGTFKGSLHSHLYLTRQSLRILQLGVRLNESELLARGEISPISQVTIKPTGLLNVSSKLKLSDIYAEIYRLRPDLNIPHFSGELKSETEIHLNGLQDIRGKADIQTASVVIDKLQLGDARIQGEYRDRVISFSEVQVSHPSGDAIVSHSQLTLQDDYDFKAHVDVKSLDAQKLFQSLNLSEVPVGMAVNGEIPCEGKIFPKIQASCTDVNLTAQNIWVKSSLDKKATAILDLENLAAKGEVHVNRQALSYRMNVSAGTSTGTSNGVIDFAKGFKVNFATKELDLKNVKNLARLKMSGAVGIEGTASGGTDSAIFDLKLNARNFHFENFFLGNLVTTAKYRGGQLDFNETAGAINNTQYIGQLGLNLHNNTLSGEFSLPTADLADVAIALNDFYRFPLHTQGSGAAKARVSGPLNFWKMNYKVESAFTGVSIGQENFDALTFNVSALNGNLQIDQVVLTKGDSIASVIGGISSEQVMNLTVDGRNWKLEQSNIISKVNSNIIGNLNVSAELKNHIKDPQVLIKGAITDTSFQEQEIPNSNFILYVNKESLGVQASLFGDKVQGEIQWPFKNSPAPLLVKIKTQDWDYSSLLGLLGGASLASEYESSLTSSIDLLSENGDLMKSTGTAQIDTFTLQRGNLSFKNSGPMMLTSQKGVMTLKNFTLLGQSNNLQVRGENFTGDKLNLTIALQSEMRLLQIFLPFLDDLGGSLHLSTTVSGSIDKPEVLGNLNTKNAFIKIKGFPHPLEHLSIDMVFSQSKVLIGSIRGNIAGGTLTGEGGIQINALKDLPTSVRLRLDGVTFNIPDRIRSSGHADLVLSGRWFPFTISGTFHVANALAEKEFTEDDSAISGVKQSFYLPKVIREAQFEPVILDLQLILERNITVRNSLLDGSVSGSLQVKGPPRRPILLGRINADPRTKLIFKDKIFEIQNGVIDFNDPDEINPNLYITAQSRIDEYDILLLTQGPSKNLTIRLSSVPPLPENEIISLIALGVTSSNLDQNLQSSKQAEQLGTEIGGAVLAKPINKQLESVTGFNLSFSNQYDSTRNISVPKISVSRRLSERVKVSGSRPARDSQSYDFKLEYLLNNNITAIGSFESRGADDEQNLRSTQPATQSIFGLDLEFKREFK